MINQTDFMQDIVKVLAATKDRAEKAAIIAELILSEQPEPVAQGVRRCIILHWFDKSLIEAMLKENHFTPNETKDIYEQIIALPFVEKLPWGFTLQDLTKEGLLKRYASIQPDLLATAARLAAPIYEAYHNDKADAEALFCYIVAGNSIASKNLISRLTRQARERGDEQYIHNLREIVKEAWQIPAELADIQALLAASTTPINIKRTEVEEPDTEKETAALQTNRASSYGDMNLLDRVLTLLRTNLSTVEVEKSAETEQVLQQLRLDMRNQLMQVKTQLATAIAENHRLRKRSQEKKTEADACLKIAEQAIQQGHDDTARKFLKNYNELIKQFQHYQQSQKEQEQFVSTMRNALRQLEARSSEIETTLDQMEAYKRNALIQQYGIETLNESGTTSKKHLEETVKAIHIHQNNFRSIMQQKLNDDFILAIYLLSKPDKGVAHTVQQQTKNNLEAMTEALRAAARKSSKNEQGHQNSS